MKSDLDAIMQARNLEALVVLGSAEHNPPMYYFVGGGHVSDAVLVRKRGQAPVLFYNDMERGEAAKSGLATRSLSEFDLSQLRNQAHGDPLLALAMRLQKILEGFGLVHGRIGVYGQVEFSSAFGMLMKLQSLMPGVEFVGEAGMDSVFLKTMETKDESEVERIRRMGAITTGVVRRVQDYLTSREVRADEVLLGEDGSPLTIGEVKSKIDLWLAEGGAENPEGTIFAIGHDAGLPHSTGNPADLVRLGQTIVFDIFPCERGGGYFYDFTRTWSLGYSTPEAQELYDQVHEIYNTLADDFDLNAPFREYQRAACEYFESKGHASPLNTKAPLNGYVHSLGHGVGLNIHERPFSALTVGDEHRLAPGVIITSEPGLYYPEREMGVRIEDTIWVRPDGKMEILAEYPYDFVLPMKRWKK
ncbi:MAG TPA: M24 family metallopeptidase [Anaerolineales bacterium]|nr:M24 family metallopeptidase [Anaerolineales bacterium]